jgi:hypothetical protein
MEYFFTVAATTQRRVRVNIDTRVWRPPFSCSAMGGKRLKDIINHKYVKDLPRFRPPEANNLTSYLAAQVALWSTSVGVVTRIPLHQREKLANLSMMSLGLGHDPPFIYSSRGHHSGQLGLPAFLRPGAGEEAVYMT